MWDMETDIFSEQDKTLALLADLVPKCRKQRRRIKAMYDCGTMDCIEQAVADRRHIKRHLNEAAALLIDSIDISEDKALFAVNQIIGLWNGELQELKYYEPEKYKVIIPAYDDSSEDDDIDDTDETDDNTDDDADDFDAGLMLDGEQEEDDDDSAENEDGGDDMLFLQDVTDEENTQEENTDSADNGGEEQSEEQPPAPKEPVLGKLVNAWCRSDCEDGRPYMFACPVGWFMIIMCAIPGIFMIYDIQFGDKLVIPTFVFMFTVLTSKRLYRFESTGRVTLFILTLYLIAMFRSMWLGGGEFGYVCIIAACAAMAVFNSGRIGTWLDESRKRPAAAYIIIILLSAAVTAGAYAVQNVVI